MTYRKPLRWRRTLPIASFSVSNEARISLPGASLDPKIACADRAKL
jgi:hypothetical protein